MPAPVDAAPDGLAPTPAPLVPDRADAPVSEVTERFLRAIVAEIPLARIEELHLFSPLRQGTVETGIAVIAARTPDPEVVMTAAPELALEAAPTAEEGAAAEAVAAEAVAAEGVAAEGVAAADVGEDAEGERGATDAGSVVVRHTVFTARYRSVIKGPERGKWEATVTAEAEAPLVTVETVVRGVQRRAGEDSEIVRFTGAQLLRALRL